MTRGSGDYIQPIFTLESGAAGFLADRRIGGQSAIIGTTEVLGPRGVIKPRGFDTWELSGENANAKIWTTYQGKNRIGVLDRRIEWQSETHPSPVITGRIEHSEPDANTSRLRMVGPQLHASNARAGLQILDTPLGGNPSIVELRSVFTSDADDSRVRVAGGLVDIVAQGTARMRSGVSGGSEVYLDANNVVINGSPLGTVQASTKVRVAVDTDPTLSNTDPAFFVGSSIGSGIGVGQIHIQARQSNAAGILRLNNAGGAVLVRQYTVVPLRHIGGSIQGTPPTVTGVNSNWFYQAGTTNVSFSSGNGTITFPVAFASGLLGCQVTAQSSADISCSYRNDGGFVTDRTKIAVVLYVGGTAFTGNANISWIAIGW